MQQFGQTIRHVIAVGEHVVGCGVCGEVEHLTDGAEHRCGPGNDPTAVTISSNQLRGKLAVKAPE